MTLRPRDGGTKKTTPSGVGERPSPKAHADAGGTGKAAAKRSTKRRAAAKAADRVPPEQRAFAANLMRLRLAAGVTQDQLAAKSGVSQSQISALEKGIWEPRLSTILALAKAFGVAPAALVHGWDSA